ncbi:MAG TPA: O-antigen ligase family protein, partial [Thermoanaerobaculia bacterium]|nr:O-antigen ligase family protein [Thermoanaerobaculia bacterium]
LSICVFGRRSVLPIAGLLILLAAGVAFYRPMHQRFREAVWAVRNKEWDQLITYRLGPWATAVAMARERPLTGWGPGTFGAEYVRHRLKVEIATRTRLTNPLLTSSYGEAHSDLLQPFAEGGIPFGLALAAAAALLLAGLSRAVRRLDASARPEAILLLAFLCAGAVAALTWFPLQRPITAAPLLLAAGRAWRISGGGEATGHPGAEGSA